MGASRQRSAREVDPRGGPTYSKPWECQADKAEIMYRYTQTQASYLHRRKAIPKNLDVF
jgi:hypothetical protein